MIENNFEDIKLSKYIIKEIKKQKINLKINDDWMHIIYLKEDRLNRLYYYAGFHEVKVKDKKYYIIHLKEKEMTMTDYFPYLVIDFDNKKLIEESGTDMGNSTESYFDEYGNQLILNHVHLDIDYNTSSLLQMLMSGITYITAQSIIDLRKEGHITNQKLHTLLQSLNAYDVYFLIKYGRIPLENILNEKKEPL